ncbi:MAG: hypothetical protein ACI35W_08345 [Anaeroplasmataceae bacterium]
MKRVQSACLLQTLHFILDPNVTKEEAIEKVKAEVAHYKANNVDNVMILREETLSDGTVILCIKKKVSGYSIGNYFND